MPSAPKPIPKMMLGFVVRRCAVALGHEPSAEEFAAWANDCCEGDRRFSLFGRPITVSEACLLLRHPARVVSARSARPQEAVSEDTPMRAGNVTSFRAAMARLKMRRAKS
jgi:hypothetical protein